MQAGKSLGAAVAALFCASVLSASSAFAADPAAGSHAAAGLRQRHAARPDASCRRARRSSGSPGSRCACAAPWLPSRPASRCSSTSSSSASASSRRRVPSCRPRPAGATATGSSPSGAASTACAPRWWAAPSPRRASPAKRLYVVRSSAGPGARGTNVRALQRRLADLGYLTPVNGSYSGSTGRAVLAFRKVNGMARSTYAGRAVFGKLARGGGGFKVRYPKLGKHAEFDWSRQVLVLARGSTAADHHPRLIGQAFDADGVRELPLPASRAGDELARHVLLDLLRRRLRDPRLPVGAELSRPATVASASRSRAPQRVYGWIDLGDPIRVYS